VSYLPRPAWCGPADWARECDAVAKTHHWLELFERAPIQYGSIRFGKYVCGWDEYWACGPIVVGWRGRVRPFGSQLSASDIWRLIADLDSRNEPQLGIWHDGSIAHLDECADDHALLRPDVRAALTPLPALDATYLIEIVYQKPPAYCVTRAVDPRIAVDVFPDMPHPVRDRGALCLAFPAHIKWTFDQHGAAKFADLLVPFLARHTLWLELRKRKIALPWLGVPAPHVASEVLGAMSPEDDCQCGSGHPLGACPYGCFDRLKRDCAAEASGFTGYQLAAIDNACRQIRAHRRDGLLPLLDE